MKVLALPALLCLSSASAFAPVSTNSKTCTFTALNLKAEAAAAGGETETEKDILHSMPKKSRRAFLSTLTTTSTAAAAAIALTYLNPNPAVADVDVEAFINSGQVSMPMGVSGQVCYCYVTVGMMLVFYVTLDNTLSSLDCLLVSN